MMSRKWLAALLGSAIINCIAVAAFVGFQEAVKVEQEPLYMEVSLEDLFAPVEEPGAAVSPVSQSAQTTAQMALQAQDRRTDAAQTAVRSASSSAVPAVVSQGSVSASAGGSGGQPSATAPPSGSPAPAPVGETRGPRALDRPKPAYPAKARSEGRQGVVGLTVRISQGGSVTEVQISSGSGHADLDQAAVATVSSWRFAPALKNGQPVASVITVPIEFSLK